MHQDIAKIPRVTRIMTAGKPACEARIALPGPETRAYAQKVYEASQRHLKIDQCGKPAAWAIDRKMLCQGCAGQAALRILVGER